MLPLAWQQRWSRLAYVRDFAELIDQIKAHAVVVGEDAIERAGIDAILGGVQIAVQRINATALTPDVSGRLFWAGCFGRMFWAGCSEPALLHHECDCPAKKSC